MVNGLFPSVNAKGLPDEAAPVPCMQSRLETDDRDLIVLNDRDGHYDDHPLNMPLPRSQQML